MTEEEEEKRRPKACVKCGCAIEPDEVALAPGMPERCADCAEPDHINAFDARRAWPRLTRMVEAHIQADNGRVLAGRYVSKAFAGEPLYLRIVREAFARRHVEKRLLRRIK